MTQQTPPATSLWVERTGIRRYTGHSSRGAEVLIGSLLIPVSGPADRDQERYPRLAEKLEVDLSGLDDEERERLLLVVRRAIDQVCTVGRTLKAGAEVTLEVAGAGS
ncbi:MAG: OsmC family peroxiredoxin [Mycobacteriaceae bacterium]|nr:OsmC family peroxiredoxin [Mycobacteriaceae bacterium]